MDNNDGICYTFLKQKKYILLLILLLIASKGVCNTNFGSDKVTFVTDHEKVTFRVLAYDFEGQDDRSFGTNMYIKLNGAEPHLVHFYTNHGDPYAHFKTNSSKEAGTLQAIDSENVGNLVYRRYEWYYPPELRGQTITFKFTCKWVLNAYYAWSEEKNETFDKEIQIPAYDPARKITMHPQPNGNILLRWSDKANMTKFSFYLQNKDGQKTHIDDAYVSAGEIQLPAAKLNSLNTENTILYTVAYQTPTIANINYIHHSSWKEMRHPGYIFPSTVNSSFDPCSKTFTLNWKKENPDGEKNGSWFIYRKERGETDASFKKIATYNSNIFVHTDNDNTIAYEKKYTYRILFKPNQFTENKFTESLYCNSEAESNRQVIDFSQFNLTEHKQKDENPCFIELSWNATWCKDSKLYIVRHDSVKNRTDSIEISDIESGKYIDKGNSIIENNKYSYYLMVDNKGVYNNSSVKPAIIENAVEFIQNGFISTKGVWPDRIKLEWEIDRLDLCNRFYIYRKLLSDPAENSGSLVFRKTATDTYNIWEDLNIEPGVLYQYTIIAENERPDKTIKKVETKPTEGIGFSQPLGTISGRITYNNGSAVNNSTVYVKNHESEKQLFKSIRFNGKDIQKGSAAIKSSFTNKLQDNFSWQAWINPLNLKGERTIFEIDSLLRATYESKTDSISVLKIYFGKSDLPASEVILPEGLSNYKHLSIIWQKKKSTLDIYIDAKKVKSETIPDPLRKTTSDLNFILANNTSSNQPYIGYIDEMRLWSKALTQEEIDFNFNRYLTGAENELIGYWQMDEGIPNYIFDRSNKNKIYNEHHFFLNEAESSSEIPAYEQLSIKGTTDKNGNYIIKGIPYQGDGTAYEVVPSYSMHSFEPSSQLRLVSMSSNVQNETNFKDISSFLISGRIVYENTDYPVEGVSFSIDGNICSKDGKIIYSDSDGEYKIDVPIGKHYIQASKNGHIFKNEGRFPKEEQFEFLEPKKINFTDETKVIIAGRVAGGHIEAEKPIGFGKGNSNIGRAKITIESYKKENVTKTLAGNIQSGNKNISCLIDSIEGKGNEKLLVLHTDSRNGEFLFRLPPIPWLIKDISTNDDKLDFKESSLPVIDINPLIMDYDTIFNDTTKRIDTCHYHSRLNLIYYAPQPDFSIRDCAYKTNGTYGDSIFSLTNNGGEVINLPLFTYEKDTLTYTFNNPVFTQGKKYEFKIKAFETYRNMDNPGNIKSDSVPLRNASVIFNNEIGNNIIEIDQNQPGNEVSEQPDLQPNKVILNDKGEGKYIFGGGFPNLGSSHTWSMQATLEYDNTFTPCLIDGQKSMTAIVLGDMPTGQSFITQGPDQILNILRDPPGSGSSAYIEKGSSQSTSKSYAGRVNSNNALMTETKFGVHIETVIGVGFAMVNSVESDYTLGVGFEEESVSSWGNTVSSTTAFSERISTSEDPDYVGHEGDVYIGNSTNLFFGLSNRLQIAEDINGNTEIDGRKYGLRIDPGYVANIESKTGFKYTHKHIADKMIPELKKMRNSFIIQVEPDQYNNYVNPFDSVVYISQINPENPDFGFAGHYKAIPPKNNDKLKADTVNWFNCQVKSWENTIRQNDSVKHLAFTKNNNTHFIKQNTSFDAGVVAEYSKTVSNDTTESTTHEFTMQLVNTHSGGIDINGTGVDISGEIKIGGGFDKSDETSKTQETTYGYTLADGDAHNFYSIDVYEPVKLGLNGFIFKTLGGQSSCPYEGQSISDYYTVNGAPLELSVATMQIEKPVLRVDEYIKNDVPTGKDAIFNLELNNLSESENTGWYKLYVDDESNPSGAILSIDGAVLTEGRLFQIQSRKELIKALSVKQSRPDILDYKDIQVILASQCETEDIADTIAISAHFVASCSDVDLKASHTLVNNTAQQTIHFIIDNYNIAYKNFAGIHLQYKEADSEGWILIKEFVNDPEKLPLTEKNELIDGRTQLKHAVDMNDYIDQNYHFRAITLCMKGNEVIKNEGVPLLVQKDISTPAILSRPTPVNGILTPDTELSIVFNEDIQENKISRSNFDIKGLLNGHKLNDNVGLSFDRSHSLYSELPLSMHSSSFCIEMWIKPADEPKGTIIDWGENENTLSLSFIDETHIKLNYGKKYQTFELNNPIAREWGYWSLSYNHTNNSVTLYYLSGKSNETVINNYPLERSMSVSGRLYFGNNITQTAGFKGDIRQISIWNDVRYISDISKDLNIHKGESTQNLQCYWLLDEGEGLYARDIMQGRKLHVKANWYLNPRGKSIKFNGSNHLNIKSGHIPFNTNQNYSVELWFKADKQANSTIFSCGKGLGDHNVKNKLSIRFNESSNLEILYNNHSEVVTSENLLNNQWHHLALSVQRNGFTNILIDGELKLQMSGFNECALVSESYTLGMCKYTTDSLSWTEEEHFTGSIDELRIWNTALTTEHIRRYKNNKLSADESSLVGYYPFEEHLKNEYDQWVISETLKDMSKNNSDIASGDITFSNETPVIKLTKPLENVDFSWVASNNQITIKLNESIKRIENCVIELSVDGILDTKGNKMSSPVKWSAFVDLNRLKWETENLVISKEVEKETRVKAYAMNGSGAAEEFSINNIPYWMSVFPTEGILNPLSKQEFDIIVNPAVNIGKYDIILTLTGKNDINEKLPVKLSVTGTKPDWEVNASDFEYSMNLTGQIQIENKYQEDADDIIGIFHDNLCVGIAQPKYVSEYATYFLFADIYGNGDMENKKLNFKLWDASTGYIYPEIEVSENVTFKPSTIIGSVQKPVILNAIDNIQQTVSLSKGWNWISTHVKADSESIFEQYKKLIKDNGYLVKSQMQYSQYDNGSWFGPLKELENNKMYLVSVKEKQNIHLYGKRVYPDLTPLQIEYGWNWISYVPQFMLPVNEALAGIQATGGDQIKGQTGFATYLTNIGWIGSLEYMLPGKGYMYNSVASQGYEFTYPESYSKKMIAKSQDKVKQQGYWVANSEKFPNNTTMTLDVYLDGLNANSEAVEIAAFVNDECRGTSFITFEESINKNLAYLMIYGESGEKIDFKAFDHNTNTMYSYCDSTCLFKHNEIIGSPLKPYIINLNSELLDLNDTDKQFRIYPIPAKDKLFLSSTYEIERYSVTDISGRIILSGKHGVNGDIDISTIPDGIYILIIYYKSGVLKKQFIKSQN